MLKYREGKETDPVSCLLFRKIAEKHFELVDVNGWVYYEDKSGAMIGLVSKGIDLNIKNASGIR